RAGGGARRGPFFVCSESPRPEARETDPPRTLRSAPHRTLRGRPGLVPAATLGRPSHWRRRYCTRMEQPLPRGVGLTALSVADARARESARPDRLFDDPFAQLFVDAAGAEFAPPSTANAIDIRAARAEYVAIRTRFFDDELRAACAAGCRQVVVLAAGLDTRAFRLEWPVGARLFELDVAEVLAFKERVLAD